MAGLMRKPQLPKSILDMKFMKRTKDRIEKESKNTAACKVKTLASEGSQPTYSNFVIESSYLVCEDLINGRLSFKGMNPEIERLMELDSTHNENDLEKDVSDEQLAKHFKTSKRNRDRWNRDEDNIVPRKKIKVEKF